MNQHPSRRSTLKFGSLALLLQAPQLAYGAEIVAVRVWPAADYTRVTIESDNALAAKHSLAPTAW
jgi:N-acetylmuramoyl-L-alanine amidase